MWTLKVEGQFHASHKLNDYQGKCANLHGHTWRIVLHIKCPDIQENGISIDFGTVKEIMKDILPDHKHLNDHYPFNPTAENISKHLFQQFSNRIPINHYDTARVVKVELYETEKNCCEYSQ